MVDSSNKTAINRQSCVKNIPVWCLEWLAEIVRHSAVLGEQLNILKTNLGT